MQSFMNKQKDGLTGFPSIDKPWLKYHNNVPLTLDVPDCSVFSFLERSCADYGNDIALEYLKKRVTYQQLFQKIEDVSKALKIVGVKQGDIVSVCLPNIPEVVYLIYAINRIGATVNMLDVRCGEKALKTAMADAHSEVLISLDMVTERFSKILKDTDVKTAVSVSALESLPSILQILAKKKDKELNPSIPEQFISWKSFIKIGQNYTGTLHAEWKQEAAAYIAYTGGTTGVPKGVIGTNKNIIAQYMMQALHGHNVGRGDRSLVIAPPWTYYGLCNSLNNGLCAGMTLVLVPKMENKQFGKMIRSFRASYIVTVPAALLSIMEGDQMRGGDYSFIHSFIVGADRLDEKNEIRMNEYLKAHGCKEVIQKGYGMTEVMAASSVTKKGADGIGSVGVPCPGVVISAFCEENGKYKECRTGENGEIAILAPTIMKGYFGYAEKETLEVLKTHEDGKIWAHTGDIGHIGHDGRLYIEGRIKRMFTRNGYKIFPATIERCIMEHDAVELAAVVSVKEDTNGHITKAYVLKRADCCIDDNRMKAELSKLTADELYEYEKPDIYEFVDKLPLTGMGKIDYRVLEQLAEKGNV